jgi:hypothetical protein
VDSRYTLYTSRSFDSALRSAVTNLRQTGLPVAITVEHGNHAWIITGFTASADPARTTDFTVTSINVVGPLWGLQSRTYGYDMKPDTKLTPKQLAGFFTPWHYAPIKMAWEGRWVSVQPVIAKLAAPKAAPSAAPLPPRGVAVARLEPIPAAASPALSATEAAVATPLATATARTAVAPVASPSSANTAPALWPAWVAGALGLVALWLFVIWRRHRSPRSGRTG